MKRLLIIGAIMLIIGLAFYFRTYEAYQVIHSDPEETYLLGIDPYYYLRHVETTYNNFPRLQKIDHSAHYPQGSYSDAAGLHVVILSGMCHLLLGDSATSSEIASVISWSSPVMSVLAFLLIFLLGREVRNIETGIISGLLLLFTPGKFYPRGLLGFVDHHIYEVFFSLVIVYLLTRMLNLNKPGNKYLTCALGGIFLSLFFTIWGGAALYIILIFGALVAYSILVDYSTDDALVIAKRIFIFFGVALIGFTSIFILNPDLLVTATHSFNDELIYIFLALTIISPLVIIIGRIKQKIRFAGIKVLSIVVAGGIGFLLATQSTYGLTFLSYLNNAFSGIVENDPVTNLSFLSYSGLIGVISYFGGISYLVWATFNHSRSNLIPIISFSLFFTFFWYQTFDLGYIVNPFMALLSGITLSDLISKYYRDQKTKWTIILPVVFLISFTPRLLFPLSYPYQYSKNEIREAIKYTPAHQDAMDWLRINSPKPSLHVDSILTKEYLTPNEKDYGIMSSWDLGNLVIQRAKRKPVWSRWPSTKTTDWFNLTSSVEAYEMLNGSNKDYGSIRYIIIDADMATSFFMAKYQLSGYSLNDCLTDKEFTINGELATMPTIGTCYDSSMVNALYRYPEHYTDYFKLVYESSEKSLLVARHSYNGQLNLLNWPEDQLDQSLLDYVEDNTAFVNGNEIYTDCLLTSTVKIYELAQK